jgi:hypothetical protein
MYPHVNSAESNAVESDKVAAKRKKIDELQREQKLIEQGTNSAIKIKIRKIRKSTNCSVSKSSSSKAQILQTNVRM